MPLSDHEQRLLDQIERALYAEDPKFASAVRATDLRSVMRRRIRWSAALFLVGVALMCLYLVNTAIAISGFAVMVLALGLALSAWRRMSGGAPAPLRSVDGPGQRTPQRKSGQRSARKRLEERWQRRWDERGGSR